MLQKKGSQTVFEYNSAANKNVLGLSQIQLDYYHQMTQSSIKI